jgi:hypothetical protein
MSELLDAASFPLHGSRLIEASAGTSRPSTCASCWATAAKPVSRARWRRPKFS